MVQPRPAPPHQIRFPHEKLPFLDELYQSHEPADASVGATFFGPEQGRINHENPRIAGFLKGPADRHLGAR